MKLGIAFLLAAGMACAAPAPTGHKCDTADWTTCALSATSGNIIVVNAFFFTTATTGFPRNPALADSTGDSIYQVLGTNCSAVTGTSILCGTTWIVAVTSTATHTFTVTATGYSPSGTKMQANEFSAQSTGAPGSAGFVIDPFTLASGSGSGSGPATMTVTTQNANEAVFGFCVSESGPTLGSGYTLLSNANGPLSEYQVFASPGSHAATCGLGAPTDAWFIQGFGIRPASAAAITAVPQQIYNTVSCDGAGTGITTLTCALTGVGTGHLLIVSTAHMPNGTIMDSQTETIGGPVSTASGASNVASWYITRTANAGTHTFSFTFDAPGGADPPHVRISEWTAGTFDVSGGAFNAGSSGPAAATATTTHPNDLLYTFGAANGATREANNQVDIFTAPTGSYYYATAAGSHTGTITMNNPPDNWTVQVLSFFSGGFVANPTVITVGP